MKLERLHEYIVPAVVVSVGMLFAALAGNMTAKGQMGTLVGVFGAAAAVTVLLVLRGQIWIVIPILWPLTGQVRVLPVPFSVRQLAVLGVLGAFVLLTAFKVIRRKPIYRFLDYWMLLILLYLASAYLRNPVGVEALGSTQVGGRPYFEVAIAALAYWVLSRSAAPPVLARLLPILIIASRGFEFLLNLIADRFPSTAPILAEFYSGISLQRFNAESSILPGSEGTQRQIYMSAMGASTVLAATTYWRPLSLLNPLRFGRWLTLFLGLVLVLLSGFRSVLATCIAYFAFSSFIKAGYRDLVQMILIGIAVLVMLVAVQGRLINLPLPAQRALSFLPGKWDAYATSDAEGSTKWRTDMWKIMLTSDKYIRSKWFGDGFGYTQMQLDVIRSSSENPDWFNQQESFMVQGAVHSGPVSTIRYVGYIGLAMFVTFLVLLARWAWQLIMRSKGTDIYYLALFVGLQALWEPLNYVFIFGAYENGLPEAIFTAGMLRMVENSLNELPNQGEAIDREPKPAKMPSARYERAALGSPSRLAT